MPPVSGQNPIFGAPGAPAFFGLVFICFFLPWVDISCQNQKLASFTGTQMVTGTTLRNPSWTGGVGERRIHGDWRAIVALLITAAGFGLSFVGNRAGRFGSILAGLLGAILLLLLKAAIDDGVYREAGGLVAVDYGAGFYLTLLLFLAAVGLNIFFLVSEPGAAAKQSEAAYCPRCGQANPPEARFCGRCGTPRA